MNKIFELTKKEEKRQRESLMMIPSENYTYPEVREIVGSILMHKYAEGRPFKRYYQGMENVDEIESYCEEKALESFSLKPQKWGVNVQAYSGSPANLAVYNALLSPGDKIMAMYLPEGGHLSHGWSLRGKKVSFVSKVYKVNFYHLDPQTMEIDYDLLEKQAKKIKPKLIISGGTAYPREINYSRMGKIAKSAGAYYLADVAHEAGLIAAGVNKSPFPYADVVTMTTHKTLRGPRGALIFARSNLIDKINESVFPGIQGGPHLHSIAGIAVALEKTRTKIFKKYAEQTAKNAKRLAQNLAKLGYFVVSGGTDKHLVLVDLRNKKTNGWFIAWALEAAGIVINRNTVPFDTSTPYYPSGIRLGTPAITVRGMKEKEIDTITGWIDKVIKHVGESDIPKEETTRRRYLRDFKTEIKKDKFLAKIKTEVKVFTNRYPVS